MADLVSKTRVVLCEPRRAVAQVLAYSLAETVGIDIVERAGSYQTAIDTIRHSQPEVVVVAFDYERELFGRLLAQVIESDPSARVVFLASPPTNQIMLLATGKPGLAILPASSSLETLVAVIRGTLMTDIGLVWSEPALSGRELEILVLLSEGQTAATMARALHLSIHTIRFHIKGLLSKLDVSTQTEAILAGIRRGYVSGPARSGVDR
ncbi:MAG: LuxR C-terminal-related transcriptional regulator [Acidimicrobiales bacterium]